MEFIESIKYDSEGYHLINLHQERVNGTFQTFYPEKKPHHLNRILPHPQTKATQKVRVIYSADSYQIEVVPYEPKEIASLKMVNGDQVNYSHKNRDRSALDALFVKKSAADDVIIIKKQFW